MNTTSKSKSSILKGKDLITIGIFTALYFVVNFIFMLMGGIHPLMWILMPAFISLFSGIPFLMMCIKVQKPGAVLIMGMIVGLFYFLSGQSTLLILLTFVIGGSLAEVVRWISKYNTFKGNTLAFILFSFGMTGSLLPVWVIGSIFVSNGCFTV